MLYLGITFQVLNLQLIMHVLEARFACLWLFAQGFLDIKMKQWLRNLMTRSIAIVPSLIVAIIGGSSGAGHLIIIASVQLFRPPSVCLHKHHLQNL